MAAWKEQYTQQLKDAIDIAEKKNYIFGSYEELAGYVLDNTSIDKTSGAIAKKIKRDNLWSMDSYDSVMLAKRVEKLERENNKLREGGRLIIEQARSYMKTPPPVKFPAPQISGDFDEHYPVVMVSDSQIGTKVTLKDTSNQETYNFDIFLERAKRLHDTTLTFKNEVYGPKFNINKLFVLLMGDMVEGELIYRSQQMYVDEHALGQAIRGSKVFSSMLRSWCKYFPEVIVYCCQGNHGRIGKDYHHMNNFDYLLYYLTKMSLKDQPNINIHISDSYEMMFDMGSKWPTLDECAWRWLIYHGDNINRYLNMPYYGVDRACGQYASLHQKAINFFALGHHHQGTVLSKNAFGKTFINGSWVGATPFTTSKLKAANTPEQTLVLMNDKYGVVSTTPVYLADRVIPKADEQCIYTPHDQFDDDEEELTELFSG